MSDDVEILEAIDRWRAEGRDLRTRLLAERQALAARMEEIDRRLGALPQDPADEPVKVTSSNAHLFGFSPLPDNISVPDAVRRVLAQSGDRPLMAREIIAQLKHRVKDPDRIKAAMVHSALFRMKDRGEVMTQTHAEGPQAFFLTQEGKS